MHAKQKYFQLVNLHDYPSCTVYYEQVFVTLDNGPYRLKKT